MMSYIRHPTVAMLLRLLTPIRGGFHVGAADPSWWVGGADLQHGRFSAKTYAKTKELCPVGDAPSRSVNS